MHKGFLGVVAAVALAAGAAQAEVTELRYSTAAPEQTPWGAYLKTTIKVAEEAAEGSLKITPFYSSQLGDEQTALRQTVRGRIDISGQSNVATSLVVPEIALLAAPNLFRDAAESDCVFDNHVQPIFGPMLEDKGLILLSYVEVGYQTIFSTEPLPDAQAAQESSEALWPALMAGTNFVLHAAGWLEGGLTMGYEKLMLDLDRLGVMARLLEGLALDDNAFAMEAFREVGIGKHFLGCAHTMANYESAFFEPDLADSSSFEQWRDAGGKDAERRAHERWTRLLRDYEAPALDPAVDEALRDFVARRKAEMADAWH